MKETALNQLLELFIDMIAERVAERIKTATPADPLLSVLQVAQRLGIGYASAKAMIDAGTLPRVPDTLRIRVRQSEVDKLGTRKH